MRAAKRSAGRPRLPRKCAIQAAESMRRRTPAGSQNIPRVLGLGWPRMADRERRRAQILTRARDVFARKGYHQAKIDDIVAAAGVARGTFYLYFHDKKSIFEELVNRFFQTIPMAPPPITTHRPPNPHTK